MQEMNGTISQLCKQNGFDPIERIEKLPESGSYRQYYRVYLPQRTIMATWNENKKENASFIAFTKHFNSKGLPVPEILAEDQTGQLYLQQDLGRISLLQSLEQNGYTKEVFTHFKESLLQLAALQIKGHDSFDYEQCITAKEFGKQAILADLLYFKYYFLDTLRLPYDKQGLLDDFDALSTYLSKTEYRYFMFRDFQSRNIMLVENNVFFIDYQGGMLGAPQYDVASLLWQAKAALPVEWKEQLLESFIDEFEQLIEKPISRNVFVSQYNGFVLLRLLQVLGAYGFRGLFERKAHFLASIPLALQNLKQFTKNYKVGIITPVLDSILHIISSDDQIEKFTPPKADARTRLHVELTSFSYKTGYPTDHSGHGGGFVFDCRGILNPGRFEQYKYLTGLDKPVIDFLEQQTRMPDFLNSAWDIVDINVEDYLKRNFDSLSIHFGCTGGQHRSVYAATQTARHLRNKYSLSVSLLHSNEKHWLREEKN
jgi:aminoglycoside/choline kinase family phosphotransferase